MKRQPRIEDYAAIGNGRSAALVSKQGAIDWLCWPRFDSPSVFAALLDTDSGGTWRLGPAEPARAARRYLAESNVLSTRFDTPRGKGRLIDLMPVMDEEAKRHELVAEHELARYFECELGELDVELLFQPRPGYGRAPVKLKKLGALGWRLEHGASLYTLRCDLPLEPSDDGTCLRGRVKLRQGQRVHCLLSWDDEAPAVLRPLEQYVPLAVARSVSWWRRWAARCTYDGPYRAQVVRSLLALKLMSFAPSGAIVAAPTTSLPEVPGGDQNWDYRFCWLRDASLTVTALHDLGYADEAAAFMSWLLHTTALTQPELLVLYDVYGKEPVGEQELEHLDGYRGARPVRVQNGAARQLQLDVYGEVVDAVTRLVRRGHALDRDARKLLAGIGGYVCDHWRRPDQGIWEHRRPPVRHTHSLLACWAAAERLLELHALGALPRIDVKRLVVERDAMSHALRTRGWNHRLGSYTEVLDGETVDASLLQMSWYGFEPASHPRQRGTFERIHERLEHGNGLIKRWEGAPDGAFGICGFWAVQQLAEGSGTYREAEERFERLLAHANDVGLFAEEIDTNTHRALGNFPQAYTHVGLIQAALALEKRRASDGERRAAAGGDATASQRPKKPVPAGARPGDGAA
ncbi:MAG: glycoside hydrolase family 15 protein [Myxococcaceae bacterium]|nr:glycoside hydrolase family 15 protein [Myxococcaceae bacterium]